MSEAANKEDHMNAPNNAMLKQLPKTDSEGGLKAELERLKAENAALKAGTIGKPITCKVSEKGAVSVYNLGRFPVTLYQEQWNKLLGSADVVKAFIEANASVLTAKGVEPTAEQLAARTPAKPAPEPAKPATIVRPAS
jgi:hypothetical protein